jgi:predicted N-formylglutamate amidohydrolase
MDYQVHPNTLGKNFIITCEHASNLLPEGMKWSENDNFFSKRHNAVDIGACLVAIEISQRLKCPSSVARYSRLYLDLNRSLNSDTLRVKDCHGFRLELNQNDEDCTKRKQLWFDYYLSMQEMISTYPNTKLFLSIHSFTPIFEYEKRGVEIGLLFDEIDTDMKLVEILYNCLKTYDYNVKLNEPYTGAYHNEEKEFCPPTKHVALKHNVPFLLLEIRQDLAASTAWRETFISRLLPVFENYDLSAKVNLNSDVQ